MDNNRAQALRWIKNASLFVGVSLFALAVSAIAVSAAERTSPPASSPAFRPTERSQSKAMARGQAKSLQPIPAVPPNDWGNRFGLETKFQLVQSVPSERIERVELGSLADQLHLQPGDMIVAVNGSSLRNAKSWAVAVERASRLGGWLTLKVKDGETGVIAYRTANLQSIRSE